MTKREQPELTNLWGTRFWGKAQTVTGDIWWHERGHEREPLLPLHPVADITTEPNK